MSWYLVRHTIRTTTVTGLILDVSGLLGVPEPHLALSAWPNLGPAFSVHLVAEAVTNKMLHHPILARPGMRGGVA